MSFINGVVRQLGTSFAGFGRQIVDRLSLVPVYLGHLLWLINQKFQDLAQEGYAGNAAVYACLRLLSTAVPEPPLIPHIQNPDGEPGDPLDFRHPLRQLIRHPNPLMTEFEFWEMVTLHCGIAGISHWWKERSNDGSILALWPLRPDRVGPIYAAPDDAESVLLGWSYQIPGTVQYVPIPRREMLTFNFPDPMGESGGIAEGLGPLQVLASEVSADSEATRFVGSLLANSAMPGMILQVKGKLTSEDNTKLLKRSLMREFGGVRRGEPMVVDNESTVAQSGFSLQELEFPALRRISESRICAAFGVPAILAGLLVGLESGIRATIEEQRGFFAETTLSSYWRRFSDQFTNDVATEYGEEIVCLFDVTKVRALAAQAAAQLTTIQAAFERGAVTVDEYREALGLPPVENGHMFLYGIAPGRGQAVPVPAGADLPEPEETADAVATIEGEQPTDQAA